MEVSLIEDYRWLLALALDSYISFTAMIAGVRAQLGVNPGI